MLPAPIAAAVQSETPEPFVSADAAAQFLSVTRRHVLELARRGIAGAYALGTGTERKLWVFRLSELAEAVTRKFESLLGVWQGAGPQGQVGCNLRLELRKSAADPSHFAGFPVLACTPIVSPFNRNPAQAQNAITAAFNPMTAVLSGTVQNGTIQFTVDKVIGKTLNGCAMTSFTVTPYGNDVIAAEWQDGL